MDMTLLSFDRLIERCRLRGMPGWAVLSNLPGFCSISFSANAYYGPQLTRIHNHIGVGAFTRRILCDSALFVPQ